MSLTLNFLERHGIKDKAQGLTEPSGLALTRARDGLWTISDDTRKVFRLDLRGRLDASHSFEIPVAGLEGIALDGSGEQLLAVKEAERKSGKRRPDEIVRISLAERRIVERRPLDDLSGYAPVAGQFESGKKNKGLEGIAWNPDRGSFFVLKEGHPGLLLEISADLRSVLGHRGLTEAKGFRDDELGATKIDYSGLCYDPVRAAFWIVSDKARRLYLYDPAADAVIGQAALQYPKDGKIREITKAEGVAVDPVAGRLYVISDKEARLYVFELRG